MTNPPTYSDKGLWGKFAWKPYNRWLMEEKTIKKTKYARLTHQHIYSNNLYEGAHNASSSLSYVPIGTKQLWVPMVNPGQAIMSLGPT